MKPYLLAFGLAAIVTNVQAAEQTSYRVDIDAAGRVSHSGKALTIEVLSEQLKELASANKNAKVLIAADEHSPLNAVTAVMDACRRVGITQFTLQSR